MTTEELLKTFVAIPSYVDREVDERDMVVKMKSLFAGSRYKIEEQVLKGKRKNIFVHDGTLPKIILLGHMDTVAPKIDTVGSSFEPRIEKEKLYGLGSIDMKAGLAIATHLLLNSKQKGLAAIFTVDEEYDCAGAMAFVKKYHLHPKMLINPEGSDLKIQNGCRGIVEFLFNVTGKATHASKKNEGVNAIEKTVALANDLQVELTKLDKKGGAKNSVNLARLNGGNMMRYGETGEPIFSNSGNIVPSFASAHVEVRVASKNINFPLMKKVIAKLALKHKVKISDLRLKNPPVGSMFVDPKELKGFEAAVKACDLPVEYRDINTSGYYEAQILWEAWGCPVVVFGPGPDGMAHKANEYVDLDTVAKAEEVVAKYLELSL